MFKVCSELSSMHQNKGLLNENDKAKNMIPRFEFPSIFQNNTTWSLSLFNKLNLIESPNDNGTTLLN